MEQNGQEIGIGTAWVAAGLLIFGILYNVLVLKFQKWTDRYTAELVVIGVLVTVVASGFVIGWGDAFLMVIFFAASGAPMLIGFWIRIAKDEADARHEWKNMVKKPEPPKEINK